MAKATVLFVQVEGDSAVDSALSVVEEALRRMTAHESVPEVEGLADEEQPEVETTEERGPEPKAFETQAFGPEALKTSPIPEEDPTPASVDVDEAPHGQANPQWRERSLGPDTQWQKRSGPARNGQSPRRSTDVVLGAVKGEAPRLSKTDVILRLIAEKPRNRQDIYDEIVDRGLSTSGAKYVALLRLAHEVDHDGELVMALTTAGEERCRQCPSSAE